MLRGAWDLASPPSPAAPTLLRGLGVLPWESIWGEGKCPSLPDHCSEFLCPLLCQEQPVAREFPLQNHPAVVWKTAQQHWADSSSCGLGSGASHLPICAPPGLYLAPTGVCAGALSLLAPHAQQHPLPCLASLSLPQGKEVEERQMAFCRLDVTHIL